MFVFIENEKNKKFELKEIKNKEEFPFEDHLVIVGKISKQKKQVNFISGRNKLTKKSLLVIPNESNFNVKKIFIFTMNFIPF